MCSSDLMKLNLMNFLGLSEDNLEYNLKFAVPDLYIPEKKISIEVQNSNLSYENFLQRTKNYEKNNIFVLWIFHESLVNTYLEDNEERVNVSQMLKKAHEIYFGVIYVYDNGKIFPLHFKSTGKYIEPNDFSEHDGYFKYYKLKRKCDWGDEIINFNLIKEKNNWKENNFNIIKLDRKSVV